MSSDDLGLHLLVFAGAKKKKGTKLKQNSLGRVSTNHLVKTLLLILIILVRLITWRQAERVRLALLFLASRRSIRLLMVSRRRLDI